MPAFEVELSVVQCDLILRDLEVTAEAAPLELTRSTTPEPGR